MNESNVASLPNPRTLQPERASGVVEAIYIAPVAGAPMQSVAQVVAHSGLGLEGDRYQRGLGYYSNRPFPAGGRHLTLIEIEILEALKQEVGISFEAHECRRNIVTRGISLNNLVGKQFTLGSILCEGVALCEPCTYLEELTGKAVLEPLVHRGGLRARLVTGGTINPGDQVRPIEEGMAVV